VMVLNADAYLMRDAVEVVLRLSPTLPGVALFGAHSIHFDNDLQLKAAAKSLSEYTAGGLHLVVREPADVHTYRRYNDLNMTHSGNCFPKSAWAFVGGYHAKPGDGLVPFDDRDFQLRINCCYRVAVSPDIPLLVLEKRHKRALQSERHRNGRGTTGQVSPGPSFDINRAWPLTTASKGGESATTASEFPPRQSSRTLAPSVDQFRQ
jgi:hypothetical protein